jgi:hypothetical protein
MEGISQSLNPARILSYAGRLLTVPDERARSDANRVWAHGYANRRLPERSPRTTRAK